MRQATFRQMKTFLAVARHESFSRAAESLFLTQPTVSMQVRQLADAVGLPLFEQVGKRVYLTEVGKALYNTCSAIFDELARFEMAVEDMKGFKKGRLRLAVVSTAEYFAPRLLGPFCRRYPEIDVTLEVANREQVLARLQSNEDDLYILGQPPDNLDVQAHPFLENPLVVLARHNHPLAREKRIPLERIAEEPFLVREPGSGTRRALERLFSARDVPINVRMELGSNEAIKQAVVGGLGVSVLSRHTLTLEASSNRLTILDVVDFPIRRYWYVAYPSGKQLSIVALAFLDYLQDLDKKIAEAPLGSSVTASTV